MAKVATSAPFSSIEPGDLFITEFFFLTLEFQTFEIVSGAIVIENKNREFQEYIISFDATQNLGLAKNWWVTIIICKIDQSILNKI